MKIYRFCIKKRTSQCDKEGKCYEGEQCREPWHHNADRDVLQLLQSSSQCGASSVETDPLTKCHLTIQSAFL